MTWMSNHMITLIVWTNLTFLAPREITDIRVVLLISWLYRVTLNSLVEPQNAAPGYPHMNPHSTH